MLHLLHDAAVPAVSSDTPTIASAVTLLAVVAQGVWAHRKGTHGKNESATILRRVEKKLGDFIETQTETNHTFDKRISEVSAHVIGPDGENGLRSRVKALEEKAPATNPRPVGMYDRRQP